MDTRTQYLLIVAVVAVCAAAVMIVKMVLEHKDRQAQREQDSRDRIMGVPLEKFGDVEADRLAQKYVERPEQSAADRPRSAVSRYADDGEGRGDRGRDRRSAPLINISINHTSNSNNTRSEHYGGNARRYTASSRPRDSRGGKSQFVALALCFFFGYLGAHHFYCGKGGMGILYLFTFGLGGIGWVVDIVRIGLGSYRDGNGRRLS